MHPLPLPYLAGEFQQSSLPAEVAQLNGGIIKSRRPHDRIAEALGSVRNFRPFLLTAGSLNSVKGSLFGQNDNIFGQEKMRHLRQQAFAGNIDDVERLFSKLREVSIFARKPCR